MRSKLLTSQLRNEPLNKDLTKAIQILANDKPDYERFQMLRDNDSSGVVSSAPSNLIISNTMVKENSSY